MPRTDLTVQTITVEGLIPTTEAANVDGEMFINTGKEYLLVNNASGGSINVTVQTPAQYGGLDVADRVVAVGAGVVKYIGPFASQVYTREAAPDSGKAYVDFSAVTSVTVAVYRLPS